MRFPEGLKNTPLANILQLPYARHYNPRFVYFLPIFFFFFMYCDLWPYVCMVSIQERVIAARVRYFNYLDLAENFAFFQPQDWPQQPPIVPLEENP